MAEPTLDNINPKLELQLSLFIKSTPQKPFILAIYL
jgi:hypothetical protein